jgi:hypothetical protein
MIFFLNGTYNGEIISYKMCAVKVRNAKLRNYLKFTDQQMEFLNINFYTFLDLTSRAFIQNTLPFQLSFNNSQLIKHYSMLSNFRTVKCFHTIFCDLRCLAGSNLYRWRPLPIATDDDHFPLLHYSKRYIAKVL